MSSNFQPSHSEMADDKNYHFLKNVLENQLDNIIPLTSSIEYVYVSDTLFATVLWFSQIKN